MTRGCDDTPLLTDAARPASIQVDVNNPGLLADITSSMTTADRDSLQSVLDTLDVQDRLAQALRLLKIELEQVCDAAVALTDAYNIASRGHVVITRRCLAAC